MQIFKRIWPQLFPAKPTIAADNLPPHAGRVVIITGDTSTLGLGLVVDFLARTGGDPSLALTSSPGPKSDTNTNYTISKTGNWFLAAHFASTLGSKRVVSITQNPGNIDTPF
ncbi:unnamed protein product [Aspergillus niger]|uniref:Unnamed protein product n=1 Tax=Aspergillus niger TaxID=5061 RepID=A0A100IML0_ASPNG|nr:unnamed protein product [Aspergillus niger]